MREPSRTASANRLRRAHAFGGRVELPGAFQLMTTGSERAHCDHAHLRRAVGWVRVSGGCGASRLTPGYNHALLRIAFRGLGRAPSRVLPCEEELRRGLLAWRLRRPASRVSAYGDRLRRARAFSGCVDLSSGLWVAATGSEGANECSRGSGAQRRSPRKAAPHKPRAEGAHETQLPAPRLRRAICASSGRERLAGRRPAG